jgi:hypothetical protein
MSAVELLVWREQWNRFASVAQMVFRLAANLLHAAKAGADKCV